MKSIKFKKCNATNVAGDATFILPVFHVLDVYYRLINLFSLFYAVIWFRNWVSRLEHVKVLPVLLVNIASSQCVTGSKNIMST